MFTQIYLFEKESKYFLLREYIDIWKVGWRGGGLDTRHLILDTNNKFLRRQKLDIINIPDTNNKFLRRQKLDVINIPYFIFGLTQDTRK